MSDPSKNPHMNGECGIDEAHSDEDHDRELTMDEMDIAGIDNIDPTREYPVRLSHLTEAERRRVERMTDPIQYVVHWTDFVANEWTEIVEGPWYETEQRLSALAFNGREDFGMKFFAVGIGNVQTTRTTVQFFNDLDWVEWLGEPTGK